MKADREAATVEEQELSRAARCRFCGHSLRDVFLDLGMAPLSNSYLKPGQVNEMEPFFPLKAWVCRNCFLVQVEEFESPEHIFRDYAYFSSYSDTWLEHCRAYTRKMIGLLGLSQDKRVVEIASNDGYLLQYFKAEGVQVLGIEPAVNVAAVAEEKGIPTLVRFFGEETAVDLCAQGIQGDLVVGNNVLAHVPQLNDFVKGLKRLLAPGGIITMEFPHLLELIEQNQFDTIYHEHFSYFSFSTVAKVFARQGITLFDVEEIPVHGGSLRIYGCHADDPDRQVNDRVEVLLGREESAGLNRLETYLDYAFRPRRTRCELLQFLTGAKEDGKHVVGYGAPAKGNTLLNYCAVGADLVEYTVDRSPHKQGCLLPGSHIPVYGPERIKATRPDYVLILPWNIRDEIMNQISFISDWGGRFVVPIPQVQVLD